MKSFFILLLMTISLTGTLSQSQEQKVNTRPDINNLAQACTQTKGDRLCDVITDAVRNYKDLELRSMELMLDYIDLDRLDKYTITGLNILVTRRIKFKRKSFLSDNIYETIDLRQNEAIFSLEYNF